MSWTASLRRDSDRSRRHSNHKVSSVESNRGRRRSTNSFFQSEDSISLNEHDKVEELIPMRVRHASSLGKISSVEDGNYTSFEQHSPVIHDVIVDVHRECSDSSSRVNNDGNKRGGEATAAKNKTRESNQEVQQQPFDLIEEYNDTEPIVVMEQESEKRRARKRWTTSIDREEMRPQVSQRKRWSTNGKNILVQRDPSRTREMFKSQENIEEIGFDNEGFESEREEMLRVETNERDSKIEIEMMAVERSEVVEFSDDSTTSKQDPTKVLRSMSEGQVMKSSRKSSDSTLKQFQSDTDAEKTRFFVNDENNRRRQSVESRSKPKKVKKKKRKKRKGEEEEIIKYIGITVHKSDVLVVGSEVMRLPMVKVHLVEAQTGNYLTSDEPSIGTLGPIVTGKFDSRENKSLIPVWEEELIFQYDFNALMGSGQDRIIIFFEIIDVTSYEEVNVDNQQSGLIGSWYNVAWAFLRPIGKNGILHTEKKVRLQLFAPLKRISHRKDSEELKCLVYDWWKIKKREKLDSSLFVTVSSVTKPKLDPVYYGETMLNKDYDSKGETPTLTCATLNLPNWTRLHVAQSCKVPNEMYFESELYENGCFYVVFSNSGNYLACVVSEDYDYPIVVYDIHQKKIFVRFAGHKNFIYSLDWSSDDQFLLSVSSDQTACIWNVSQRIMWRVEILPHPSYVYCGKFDPSAFNTSIIATGGYDRTARIWGKSESGARYDLIQELEAHDGFINSLCFKKDDGTLLTADSLGVIIIWTVKKVKRSLGHNTRRVKEWRLSKVIKSREIEGIIINSIVLHPLGSRLLVHSRNNGLRMLDLTTGVILQRYKNFKNQRVQLNARISPCGGLILCGDEEARLNIWSLETGAKLASYSTFSRVNSVITCVDYHPHDHILAYSTFGVASSVKLLKYNAKRTSKDETIGLTIAQQETSRLQNGDFQLTDSLMYPTIDSESRSLKHSASIYNNKQDSMLKAQTKDDLESKSKWETLQVRSELPNLLLDKGTSEAKFKSTNRLNNIIEKIDVILNYSKNMKFLGSSDDGSHHHRFKESGAKEPSDYLGLREITKKSNGSSRSENSKRTRKNSNETEISRILPKVDQVTPEMASSNDSERTYDVIPLSKSDNNIKGIVASDTSAQSNATFTIESELPVPKPRSRKEVTTSNNDERKSSIDT